MARLGAAPAKKPVVKTAKPAVKRAKMVEADDIEDAPARKVAAKKAPPAAKRGFPARKTGGAVVRKPPVKFEFEVPPDFAPAFFELTFKTTAEGTIAPTDMGMSRVKGNWSNPEARRFDMWTYDAKTIAAVISRFAAATFAPRPERRLPADHEFYIVLRVNKRAATGALAVILKQMQIKKPGKKWRVFTDKADPVYRKLRRTARTLPSAFMEVQLPPSRRKTNSAQAEESDD